MLAPDFEKKKKKRETPFRYRRSGALRKERKYQFAFDELHGSLARGK
jgi:hypothetical protein